MKNSEDVIQLSQVGASSGTLYTAEIAVVIALSLLIEHAEEGFFVSFLNRWEEE